MSNSPVAAARTPGVLTLTLNRPDVLNGLTLDMLALIGEELGRAADDDEIRVVVITGAGRGFCSGLDLRASGPIDAAELRSHLQNHYSPVIRAIRDLPKPVLAAVNGVAAGAGMSLALAADFRSPQNRHASSRRSCASGWCPMREAATSCRAW
jgi:2-(1,2-epoxy-1,2-dihydrophenyl)acetyl-CoA isomerase